MYSQEFVELQLLFARKVVSVFDESLDVILVKGTVLHFMLGLGSGQAEKLTRQLVKRIEQNDDAAAWAHDQYLRRQQKLTVERSDPPPNTFGYFNYSYPFQEKPKVRLHFHNRFWKTGVLSGSETANRQAELRELLQDVKHSHPEAETVVGGSWLYHTAAYRRLFPPDYLATAQEGVYETGFLSLWGQFLRGDGSVRLPLAKQFTQCLTQQASLEGCISCFPHDVLRLESDIQLFYDYFGI